MHRLTERFRNTAPDVEPQGTASALLERLRAAAAELDAPATAHSLRERAKDLFEDAIDRLDAGADERPGARVAAGDLRRNSRSGDLASAALVAIVPAVVRTLRERRARRLAKRRTVAVIASRPVLLGGGLAATVLSGWAIMRFVSRMRRPGAQELQERQDAYVESADPTSFELEQQVDAMLQEDGVGVRHQPAGNGATVATPSPH